MGTHSLDALPETTYLSLWCPSSFDALVSDEASEGVLFPNASAEGGEPSLIWRLVTAAAQLTSLLLAWASDRSKRAPRAGGRTNQWHYFHPLCRKDAEESEEGEARRKAGRAGRDEHTDGRDDIIDILGMT